MLMDGCNFQTTGKWCHFAGCNRRRAEVWVRSCQSGASRGTMASARVGRPLQPGGAKSFFWDFFFFFPGGNQNKSEWHLDRRAASRRERAASWLTKNEFCLRSALKWARAWKLMIELLINHPRPHSPALHLNSPAEKNETKKNTTLEAGILISSKWAFKIGGERIYICYQRRLWLVSRRRCWMCWSDVCYAGTATFRRIALPTVSEKQLAWRMNERMWGYFPRETETEPSR